MPKADPRVDAYIAGSADFARPILENLRKQIHGACPQVEETIKWGFPHFVHAGGVVCFMAAFKRHAAFGFHRAALLAGIPPGKDREAMGQFGRLLSTADLPSPTTLASLLRQAARLNEDGTVAPRRTSKKSASPSPMPRELALALSTSRKARSTYDSFPPGEQREYRDWIAEAKQEATRKRRAAQAVEWLAEGKRRNWKYAARRE
ncbi:YdeI family protein [Dokdonella sp.]|uniref:YdeI/OmpD-associated family protein n=1 Tax=Dokdonella sp. TaxID=2291710 RepID=UPI00352788C3